MKRFVLFALLLVLTSPLSLSGKTISADAFLRLRNKTEVANPVAKASYYLVDPKALAKNISGGGHLEIMNFPCGKTDNLTLDLKPAHSAITSETQCIVTSPQGDIHVAPPQLIVYRGKILGEEHSRIFLTISDATLICSILREDGTTYVFAPEKNSSEFGAHMLIAETDLLATAPFKPFDCLADDINQPHAPTPVDELLPHHSQNEIQAAPLNNGKLLQTDIAVEADSQFYGAIGGDPSKTIAYIGAIFSMSSMIYEDEANLTHHLTWIKVWTTSDPYQVHGDAYALETIVKTYWQQNYTTVQRDLAHIMTSTNSGGGGFGYYSLCDNANSYSVSSPQTGHKYPTFAFTYDVYIISHEIGHNFTLIHSHDCYWNPPLDTCYTKDDAVLALSDACYSKPVTPRKNPGTIMSYCANANYALSGNDFSQYKLEMTFSPRPDSVLRVNAEKAACIQPPSDPVVILLSPRGSGSYTGNTTITLKWTYALVQNVSLEYSPDGGTTWNPIASGLSAATATYDWKMPNVPSTKMLVRIFDAVNHAIGDTSLIFFSVVKNAVRQSNADEQQFLLVPTPANDYFVLTTKQQFGMLECDLLDELGIIKKHLRGNATIPGGMNIDVSGLASGKYFLHVKSTEGVDKTLPVFVVH